MSDKKFYKEGEMCKYVPAKATYEHLPSAVIKHVISQMLQDIFFFPGEESQKICHPQVMHCHSM